MAVLELGKEGSQDLVSHLSELNVVFFALWFWYFLVTIFLNRKVQGHALRSSTQKYASPLHLGLNPICLELAGKAEVGTWWS